jgi:thiosulfate/3-mercaptopyruvate sulfurtransferase
MTANGGYARPDLLVQTDWLADHQDDPNIRIIDCAAIEGYRRAHITGAVGLPVHFYVKDPADSTYVMPPEQFAELMGGLGVGDDTLVITYDDNNSLLAARMWWVLQHYGHTNAKLLDGGWNKWFAEGRPATTHATHPQPASFTSHVNEDVICRVDDLKAKVGAAGTRILDVRSPEEYAGTSDRGNARKGHVPGAAHIEWTDFVTRDDNRVFKPAAEIKEMLDRAGISPEQEVVTY